MSIFGGWAIFSQLHGVPIAEAVMNKGPEADAMTSSMGGMSTTGISPESPEPSMLMKIFWGVLLCVVS